MTSKMFRYLFFFFFKQKTAYEMRISDWSSDVCSSDLVAPFAFLERGIDEDLDEFVGADQLARHQAFAAERRDESGQHDQSGIDEEFRHLGDAADILDPVGIVKTEIAAETVPRSEERRVGKECVSTCRSRWSSSD